MGRFFKYAIFPIGLGLLWALPAYAEEAPQLNGADTAWILVSSALVMLMLPGLALFYGGMVRRKNVLSTIMHSFIPLGVITIQWILIGYSLSFGSDIGGFVGGFDKVFLNGTKVDTLSGTIPEYLFCMFQLMFAIITVALISGGIAERVSFKAYVVFIFIWSTLVYDPICHWVWGGGWLGELGALDFAGGTVVHISSGVAGLAAALYLKKRRGFPGPMMIPHNLPLVLLGAGLLWFGWFGFNAGSALAADQNAVLAFTNTQVATGAGMIGWLIAEQVKAGKPSALGAASGIVAGLVAITPAAGFVSPLWAMVIGVVAGMICYLAVILKHRKGIDDSLDVFGIHGVGGAWGALATGLFVTHGGTGLLDGNLKQVGVQVVGVAAAALYSFVVTYGLVVAVDKVVGFRVDEEDEEIGLDATQHGESGYNLV
ncbi:Ammonium transporter Amt [Nitrospina gracilis 3/211]|uniref:Ammonium transporter n=1 Tax=Nitrospina gracilis (strain 3/211) TaxID=1266370 RepID=M1Z1Y7_NITG3|nr:MULTISPECIES: ammonium transporter [Nitrospina]MCF8724747.1 Amt family ammonium transporter [Nitrospina sp. Nb-3]CCQ92021.1 Ammonium transporter Amt [Nitrospina gracilis 3/211]